MIKQGYHECNATAYFLTLCHKSTMRLTALELLRRANFGVRGKDWRCSLWLQVTNVDDEGNELGSGTMELTQTELILHTRKRDAIRWPYLCLRRYGYDSNLFSFESGRRCQTGQGETSHSYIWDAGVLWGCQACWKERTSAVNSLIFVRIISMAANCLF